MTVLAEIDRAQLGSSRGACVTNKGQTALRNEGKILTAAKAAQWLRIPRVESLQALARGSDPGNKGREALAIREDDGQRLAEDEHDTLLYAGEYMISHVRVPVLTAAHPTSSREV